MVTSTVAAPASRRSGGRLLFKIALTIVLLAVVAAAGFGIWFYRAAHASLAQLDGTIALAGLHAPVQVIRDAHGVPHITAANLEDLFLSQGYVTAQDRLWQMDVTRRAMAGEMAEIFPASSAPSTAASRINGAPPISRTWVDYDKQQRILRLRSVAERVAAQMSDRDRAFFNAYARGVNLYIEQHRDNLPIEFRLLRYSPREWKPADSVLIGVGMSQLLNPQFEMEYKREHTAKLLSPELMADLFPAGSPRDHAPASDAVNAGVASEPRKPQGKTTPAKQPASKSGHSCFCLPRLLPRTLLRTTFLRTAVIARPAFPVPTTGWSPARTPPRESRCSPMTCICRIACPVCGLKPISTPANTTLKASHFPACPLSSSATTSASRGAIRT